MARFDPTGDGQTRLMPATSPSWRLGRLLPASQAPESGERFQAILTSGDLLIEQILSGRNVEPSTYLQDHDEWVAVLAGRAAVDVDGGRVDVAAGDWLFLPAGVPHAVLETAPGTSWLAVHLPRS